MFYLGFVVGAAAMFVAAVFIPGVLRKIKSKEVAVITSAKDAVSRAVGTVASDIKKA